MVNITLNIPPFSNLRTVLNVSAIDLSTNKQFGAIQSLKIISAGRNVDGLLNEYNLGLMPGPTFYMSASDAAFYYDTAVFDLGIITNTSLLIKLSKLIKLF